MAEYVREHPEHFERASVLRKQERRRDIVLPDWALAKWLREEVLRLSHLSERLDLVVQEASRHLSRLCEAKLVVKGADGCTAPRPA